MIVWSSLRVSSLSWVPIFLQLTVSQGALLLELGWLLAGSAATPEPCDFPSISLSQTRHMRQHISKRQWAEGCKVSWGQSQNQHVISLSTLYCHHILLVQASHKASPAWRGIEIVSASSWDTLQIDWPLVGGKCRTLSSLTKVLTLMRNRNWVESKGEVPLCSSFLVFLCKPLLSYIAWKIT